MNNVLMCYLVQSANNFMIFASTSSGIQVCNFVFRVPVWLCHQINAGLIKKVWRYSLFFHSLQKLEKKTILFKCSINSAVNPSSPGLYLREDFTTNSISSLIIDLFRFSFFFFFHHYVLVHCMYKEFIFSSRLKKKQIYSRLNNLLMHNYSLDLFYLPGVSVVRLFFFQIWGLLFMVYQKVSYLFKKKTIIFCGSFVLISFHLFLLWSYSSLRQLTLELFFPSFFRCNIRSFIWDTFYF